VERRGTTYFFTFLIDPLLGYSIREKISKGGPKDIFCPAFMDNICGDPIGGKLFSERCKKIVSNYTQEIFFSL
jgi:hypothetical protein